MAGNTITQRIALDGGADIKTALDNISKAAQQAFANFKGATDANSLLTKFGTTLDAVQAKVKAVQEAASKLGDNFSNLGSAIETSGKRFAEIGTVTAGAVAGFVLLVKGAADAADQIQKTAEAVGLSVKDFQNLSFAFGQAGVDQDQFARGLTKFNAAVEAAKTGQQGLQTKTAALNREVGLGRISFEQYTQRLQDLQFESTNNTNAFTKLGLSVAKLTDGSVDTKEKINLVADALSKMNDGQQKSAITLELFGAKNSKFVAALNQGRAGIAAFTAEAERVAPPLTKLQLQTGTDLREAFERLSASAFSAKEGILLLFAPAVTRLADAFTEVIVADREAAILFAGALADKLKPIVTDIIALLQGRDADVKNGFIIQSRDAVLSFAASAKHAVTDIIMPALSTLLGIFNIIAQAINGVFGTKLTGTELAIALIATKAIGLFGVLRAAIGVVISAIGLLITTFGLPAVALAALGVAIGFFLVKAVGGLDGLKTAWTTAWNAIESVVTQTLRGFSIIATAVVQAIVEAFTALGSAITAVWDGIVSAVQAVGKAIVTAFSDAVKAVIDFFAAIPDTLKAIFAAVVKIATDAWNAIAALAQTVAQGVVAAFSSAVDSLTGFFKDWYTTVSNFFDSLLQKARSLVAALPSFLGGAGGGGAPAPQGPGFAEGGAVEGPGTGTSDSIVARISNGEFVQRAAAVSKYGSRFMHAINRGLVSVQSAHAAMSGLNVSGAIGSLTSGLAVPRFKDGGGFAVAGGTSGGGSTLHLHIGSQSFGPFHGSDDVMNSLHRGATKQNLRSAGPKPVWFGGG